MMEFTIEQKIITTILGSVLLMTILVDIGLFLAWTLRRDAELAGVRPPLFAPRWSLVDVWIAGQLIVVVMIALFLAAFIASIGAGFIKMSSLLAAQSGRFDTSFLWITALSLFPQNLLLVLVPAWFITRKYGVSLTRIGLMPLPRARDWRIGLVAGIAVMVLGFGMEKLITALAAKMLSPAMLQVLTNLTKQLGNEQFLREGISSPVLFLLLLVGGGICAPIGEEFFFRGFLYNAAKRRLGILGGTLLSAVVFGVIHGGPFQILGIIPMGILLAVMYERTRSLWVPMIMHAFNNTVGLILLYLRIV
ncbi:MAG TPA: CPBP family intramembrane glutamic endopeptidase [Chthonomonadales bacterium]|nr:CPBP family intramembrane glutamic endopeptidase [Chthonomonadales bacterium]